MATSQRQKSQAAFYDQRPLNTLSITWSKWAKGCDHKHENVDLLQLNDMSDGCVPQNYFTAPINSSLTKPEIHDTKKKENMLPHPQETCLSHENSYFKFRSVFRTTTWKILASLWSGFTQHKRFPFSLLRLYFKEKLYPQFTGSILSPQWHIRNFSGKLTQLANATQSAVSPLQLPEADSLSAALLTGHQTDLQQWFCTKRKFLRLKRL